MKTVNRFQTTIFLLLCAAFPLFAQQKPKPAPTTKAPEPTETRNDLKLSTRISMESFNMDSTVYIKGERERTEQMLPGMNLQMVTIKECDLRRNIQINDNAKVYKIEPFAETNNSPATNTPRPASPPPAASNKPTRKGGVVTINITMTDTGERKEMFGYQARHLKMAMSFVASPDACSKANMRMESDGWYINFRNNFSCEEEYVPRAALERSGRSKPDCVDEWRYNIQGNVKMGYPADVTMTMYNDNKPFTMRQQILELSRAKLEQALFEIPPGYKEGDPYSMSAMMGGMNLGSLGKMAEAAARKEEAAATGATGAKKAGAIRIGVVSPAARIGQNDVSGNVRSSLIRALSGGPAVEVVPLNAPMEAAAQQCDFVVTSVLSHQPGKSGGLGGFMKKAGNIGGAIASGNLPTGGGDTSSQIKARDEVGFEYQLTRVNGAAVASNSAKRKANNDGDDVISPLLSQAASEILKAVTQK